MTTSGMANSSKLGINATKKLPGEDFKRYWPPLIRMDEAMRREIDALFKKILLDEPRTKASEIHAGVPGDKIEPV